MLATLETVQGTYQLVLHCLACVLVACLDLYSINQPIDIARICCDQLATFKCSSAPCKCKGDTNDCKKIPLFRRKCRKDVIAGGAAEKACALDLVTTYFVRVSVTMHVFSAMAEPLVQVPAITASVPPPVHVFGERGLGRSPKARHVVSITKIAAETMK